MSIPVNRFRSWSRFLSIDFDRGVDSCHRFRSWSRFLSIDFDRGVDSCQLEILHDHATCPNRLRCGCALCQLDRDVTICRVSYTTRVRFFYLYLLETSICFHRRIMATRAILCCTCTLCRFRLAQLGMESFSNYFL